MSHFRYHRFLVDHYSAGYLTKLLRFHYPRDKPLWVRVAWKANELPDLLQEATIALLRAQQKYRPGSNASFPTFAYTVIRRHLLDYREAQERPVRYLRIANDPAYKQNLIHLIHTYPLDYPFLTE